VLLAKMGQRPLVHVIQMGVVTKWVASIIAILPLDFMSVIMDIFLAVTVRVMPLWIYNNYKVVACGMVELYLSLIHMELFFVEMALFQNFVLFKLKIKQAVCGNT
jgi:hypothetical protein